jgi:opacity protein-like surface antigen
MKRFLMTLIVAAVFMATSAQAANGKLYFAGTAGLSIASDLEEQGVEVSFDPGWNITGAVGYDFGRFRVEGEIGYRTFDIDEVSVPGFPPVSLDGDASALTFMANGYYDHELRNSPLTPYIGFGLGIADAEVEVTIPGLGTLSTDDTEFAYQFMVGAGYEVAPNVVLTGGYRFFGIADSGAPDSHEFNLGARFMF